MGYVEYLANTLYILYVIPQWYFTQRRAIENHYYSIDCNIQYDYASIISSIIQNIKHYNNNK